MATDALHPGPYIRFSKEFYMNTDRQKTDIITYLLTVIALCVQKDHKNKPLVVDGKPCLGKAKRYIAFRATQFIREIKYVNDPLRIKRFTSKAQINNLIQKQPAKITCYGAIITYTILWEISESAGIEKLLEIFECKKIPEKQTLEAILECCHEVVAEAGKITHTSNPNIDELIDFFLDCARVFKEAIEDSIEKKKAHIDEVHPGSLPYIPVLHP